MKILVFAHQLEVGGTQTNAIELSAALRDLHNHEVVLFATPGPMVELAEEKGLRFIPAPEATFHPSMARMRALRKAVRSEKPDVIHIWDWWQCLDAYCGVYLPMRIPIVVSDMMMELTRILPKALPTTFGTPEIVDHAKENGRSKAELIPPPVDVRLNAPGVVECESFRQRFNINPNEINLVSVSRLDHVLKLESLIRSIRAIRQLGQDLPLKLIIVGEGAAKSELQEMADETNEAIGREAVILTGALIDPRPAYAAADIVIGMGGSALRAMAFAKPVVVVGKHGFAETLSPETAESFYYKGIYGTGNGDPENSDLCANIKNLAENPTALAELGSFGRQFVEQRFSLEMVSKQLETMFLAAMAESRNPGMDTIDAFRTIAIYIRERRFIPGSLRIKVSQFINNIFRKNRYVPFN